MKVRKRSVKRIWGDSGLRLFISHTSPYKEQAAELGIHLSRFGISVFVAHENIEPNKRWQKEILRALFTMHMLVALLTEDFARSKWTDQEVGVALGREVPVVSVSLGADPYGFIGNVQAISGSGSPDQWAETIFGFALQDPALLRFAVDGFINATESIRRFSEEDHLFERYLPKISNMTENQHSRLVKAFNENDQVHGAFAYNRFDVPSELKRLTGLNHYYKPNGKLEYEPF